MRHSRFRTSRHALTLALVAAIGVAAPGPAHAQSMAPWGGAPGDLVPGAVPRTLDLPIPGMGPAIASPNRGLSPDQAAWHTRAALNVAALACRDREEAQTVAAYNQLLRRQTRPLADADAAVKADFRARLGEAWEAAHETQMTRVYNFFAQPAARAGFCTAARTVLREAGRIEPAAFRDFAAAALSRLEAPFFAPPTPAATMMAWNGQPPRSAARPTPRAPAPAWSPRPAARPAPRPMLAAPGVRPTAAMAAPALRAPVVARPSVAPVRIAPVGTAATAMPASHASAPTPRAWGPIP